MSQHETRGGRPRDGREGRGGESRRPRRVVVIGGGIAGLSAAWELAKAAQKGEAIELTVLEASPRVGGKIRTELVAGQVVETGPDSFLTTKPEMLELVRELGLGDELIGTGSDPRVSVLVGGRLRALPSGMDLISPTRVLPFAFSSLFTWRAKLRMALEPFRPPRRDPADESLADFARRRLGPEALDRLVGPMLAGLYAGDPEKLSVKSTFPQLVEAERRGGVVRGLWSGAGRSRPKREPGVTTFMTLKGGLQRVVDELAKRLPARAVRTDCPAQALRRRGGAWEVLTPHGPIEADAVISALPAPAFADVVESHDPELAMRLREIPFTSTATVALVYDDKDLKRKPSGFGFLSARGEGLTLNAATFSSSKFPARALAGKTAIRAFVGGAGREADAEGAVTRMEMRCREDLDKVLGLGGAQPVASKVTRWIKANPQYEVGHARRLDRLISCLKSHPGLVLAGSSYNGVGLPDCVRSGRRAAELARASHRRDHDAARSGLV